MSDFRSTDINQSNKTQATNQPWLLPSTKEETKKSNTELSFEDMLLLMVTQLQNQTIDNQADTNDMMNQLIQMTVMQAMTEMTTQVEELTTANIMSYSASLVGKEVTVGVLDNKGNLADEVVGVVTATGTYNGQQVIFIGEKYYPLSSIMSVGRLPETAVDGSGTTKPKPGEGEDDKTEGSEDATKPGESTDPGGVTDPDNTDTGETEPEGGESGAEPVAVRSGVFANQNTGANAVEAQSRASAVLNRPVETQPAAEPPHTNQRTEAVQGSSTIGLSDSQDGPPSWLTGNGGTGTEQEHSAPDWLIRNSGEKTEENAPASWLI